MKERGREVSWGQELVPSPASSPQGASPVSGAAIERGGFKGLQDGAFLGAQRQWENSSQASQLLPCHPAPAREQRGLIPRQPGVQGSSLSY